MGRAYTEEDWQNMTVAERWNTDYSRMAHGWASKEEPRPAHLSDLGNSNVSKLQKLQDRDSSFLSTAGDVALNMVYPPWSPTRYIAGKVSDAAGSAYDAASDAIGSASDVFSNAYDATKNSFNQYNRDKRFQQAALSDDGIQAYHPSNAPYNRNAKLRALQSGTFSRDPITFKESNRSSLGTAAAKDVALSKLMAEQNRMQQGQLRTAEMKAQDQTGVGFGAFKPSTYSNVSQGPNSLSEHAGLDRLAALQEKVNRENLAALGNNKGNDLSAKWQNPGVPDRVFNIQQSPVKKRNTLGQDILSSLKDFNENSSVAKFFANHKGQPLIGDDWFNFKNSALAKALANADGQGLLGNDWWDIRPGSIIKTIEDLNIPDIEGNNFLEKFANFDANASRGGDILMTNDTIRGIWGGDKTSMEDVKDAENYTGKFPNNDLDDWKTYWGLLSEEKETVGAGTTADVTKTDDTKTDGTKTDGTKTDGTKTDVVKGDTVGGGGWVDDLHKPIPGGAGVWDTNFNRGMEMLEWVGTPLSKRGDHPSKGWRATDTAARKANAALAKAALDASGTSIFGKADHDDIKEALRAKLRDRFGMDNWYTYIPGFGKDEAAFESALSGAALAVQSMIEENNISFAQAMASFLKE